MIVFSSTCTHALFSPVPPEVADLSQMNGKGDLDRVRKDRVRTIPHLLVLTFFSPRFFAYLINYYFSASTHQAHCLMLATDKRVLILFMFAGTDLSEIIRKYLRLKCLNTNSCVFV